MPHDIIGTGPVGNVCALQAVQLCTMVTVVGKRATDVEDQLLALLVH